MLIADFAEKIKSVKLSVLTTFSVQKLTVTAFLLTVTKC